MISMSKKIDAAVAELIRALRNHAEAMSASRVSLKKSQRAVAKLQTAATAYAVAVHAKTGLGSPFDDLVNPGLETTTVDSLVAERDALASKTKQTKADPSA